MSPSPYLTPSSLSLAFLREEVEGEAKVMWSGSHIPRRFFRTRTTKKKWERTSWGRSGQGESSGALCCVAYFFIGREDEATETFAIGDGNEPVDVRCALRVEKLPLPTVFSAGLVD